MALVIREANEQELDSILALNNAAGPGIRRCTCRLRALTAVPTKVGLTLSGERQEPPE